MIVVEAVRAFAGRYASLAAQLAEREEATARRKELSEMARILQKVPYEPAGSFREAVQMCIRDSICTELKLEEKFVSVSIQDIPIEEWELSMERIPKETILVK